MSDGDRAGAGGGPDANGGSGGPIEMPIDGILDLHTFAPADVASVVAEYLDACRAKGILHVRVIHGKGTGTLREIVHAVLRRRSDVVRFGLAADAGSWGATLVELTRPVSGAAERVDRDG